MMPNGRDDASIDAIRREVLDGPAVTSRDLRARVMANDPPAELRDFWTKVREASYRVTDEDLAALRRAGLTEEQIYELTVAAAVGIACDRLDIAKRSMKGAA